MITVYGLMGEPSSRLRAAVATASLVVGGQRHLDALDVSAEHRVTLGRLDPAIDRLVALPDDESAVVIASGDPLVYGIVRRLRQAGLRPRVVPAPTSVAMAFGAVGLPWDDAVVVSAHGRAITEAVHAAQQYPKVAVLTAPGSGLIELAHALAGLEHWFVLAERLGEDDERVQVLDGASARALTQVREPNVVLILAHHPDNDAATGAAVTIMGRPPLTPAIPNPAGSAISDVPTSQLPERNPS